MGLSVELFCSDTKIQGLRQLVGLGLGNDLEQLGRKLMGHDSSSLKTNVHMIEMNNNKS